jgi:hypothetical protein
MIVDRYEPMNLFEIVPKLNLQMEPELVQLDELLDDDELFSLVKADLIRRYIPTPEDSGTALHTCVEVILRMLVLKKLHGFSYEPTPSVSSPIRSS